jgi:hypothetical protein
MRSEASSPDFSGGKGNRFSGGPRRELQSADAHGVFTPTKFPDARSPSSAPHPTVYTRECKRLDEALQTDVLMLKADLQKMVDEWHTEMGRLKKALTSDGLQTLLDHLAKVNPRQERELRAYADELTGVLATAKVLRQLHQPVKTMQKWDELSRDVLDAIKSQQTSLNVVTTRKQAFSYYVWSAFSLGRAAAFSCYLANVAGAGIPSLVLAGAIVVPAALHTMIMVRDYYRSQEIYYANRSKAFQNMGHALRGLEDFPNHSVDDAQAMMAFRDAFNKLPENSHAAALDANRALYAAIRDQAIMPVNILASTIGNILTLVAAPQSASSTLLILSALAYAGQGVLDNLQGKGEAEKAQGQADRLHDWLDNQAVSDSMQSWADENAMNRATLVGMQAHNRRSLDELEPELFGARARQVKGSFNFVNTGLAATGAGLNLAGKTSLRMPTIAGTVASAVSLGYMAITATKILLRGDVRQHAKERFRQAQLILAMYDPRELLALIEKNEGRALTLEIPKGGYDEQDGFVMTRLQVRPWENEFIALEALADAVDEFAVGNTGKDDQIPVIMLNVWKMKPLDWVNLLRVLSGMRDATERNSFIKQTLAKVVKVDYVLEADGFEPALPSGAVVQAFLRRLEKAHEYLDLAKIFEAQEGSNDEEAAHGAQLRELSVEELKTFGEDAFLAAMDDVWPQRQQSSAPTAAKLKLFALKVLADHIYAQRKLSRGQLLASLEGADKKVLTQGYPSVDVALFIEAVRQLLQAEPGERGKRRTALFHLARMQLTQRLLENPARMKQLQCRQQLMQILGLVERNLGPRQDTNNDLIYSVDGSSQSFSETDAVVTTTSENADSDADDPRSTQASSPVRQRGEAQADETPTDSPQSPGAKLWSLMREPYLNIRKASNRSQKLLEAVVMQLTPAPPTSINSNSSRLQLALPALPPYTPAWSVKTPLPNTPRREASQTPLVQANSAAPKPMIRPNPSPEAESRRRSVQDNSTISG